MLIDNSKKYIKFLTSLIEVSKAQRRAEKRALTYFAKTYNKQVATAHAYLRGHHTMAKLADYFNVQFDRLDII